MIVSASIHPFIRLSSSQAGFPVNGLTKKYFYNGSAPGADPSMAAESSFITTQNFSIPNHKVCTHVHSVIA